MDKKSWSTLHSPNLPGKSHTGFTHGMVFGITTRTDPISWILIGKIRMYFWNAQRYLFSGQAKGFIFALTRSHLWGNPRTNKLIAKQILPTTYWQDSII